MKVPDGEEGVPTSLTALSQQPGGLLLLRCDLSPALAKAESIPLEQKRNNAVAVSKQKKRMVVGKCEDSIFLDLFF